MRTRRGRSLDPDVHTYCACGAQWHGRHAVGNKVIDAHRFRKMPWHVAGGCRIVSEATFRQMGFRVSLPPRMQRERARAAVK